MSMVIDLVKDHNIYLCEGGPVYNGGVQPTPITYLTQWKIVGNSEVHGNEIWSCGVYNSTDGKWHVLVQPLGGNIADIALTEPLRKVGNVADTIEFEDNVATVLRLVGVVAADSLNWSYNNAENRIVFYANCYDMVNSSSQAFFNILCVRYDTVAWNVAATNPDYDMCIMSTLQQIRIRDKRYTDKTTFINSLDGLDIYFELATPTTELVDAPQIEEAESYTCVISQGAKAVSWSSFEIE